MKFDLLSLEVEVLTRLYKAKEKELEDAVLRGSSWNEISLRRKAFLELSSALHTKLQRQGEVQSQKFPTRPEGEQ